MAPDDQIRIAPRTRLLVAGSVGLLIALLAAMKIMHPILGEIAQFPQFSPLMRAAFLIKVLSPLLSFFLAGYWVWILLLLGEHLLTFQVKREKNSQRTPPQHPQEQRPRYRLERVAIPLESSTNEAPWKTNQRARPLAVPSLFQLDPTMREQYDNLPMTPLPMTNPEWFLHTNQEEDVNEKSDGGEHVQENASMTQEEWVDESKNMDITSQREENEAGAKSNEAREDTSLEEPEERPETQKPVTITLLMQMRAWVHADDGTILEIKLRGGEKAIRLLLLAHIAWRKGEAVSRDKMLTYVLSRGKRRDMTTDQLGEVFDAAKRYLRQDLDRAVNELKHNGHMISTDVDFFQSEPGFYQLHPSCQVADLEMIEEYYRTIQIARKEGVLDEKLDGSIPAWVIEACQKLIDAYPGDFLQSLIDRFPDEFGSWVREPFTLYRDYYLDALLIIANYESACGRNGFDKSHSREQIEEQRRRHSARAAQFFYDYAMHAIKSAWDRKLKFTYKAGKDGERVIRAERAMRRCVVELGKLGQPDTIDQVYSAFKERMTIISEGYWKPDPNTENDVVEAKKTTSAYRFSSQIVTLQQDLIKK